MTYNVEWFIPQGSEPLEKQAEKLASGTLHYSPALARAAREDVARQIQALDDSIERGVSVKGEADGIWLQSVDEDSPIPYVELGNGTGMVAGAFGSSSELDEYLLAIYAIFEKNGYIGYDPQLGKIFKGVQGFLNRNKKLKKWRLW